MRKHVYLRAYICVRTLYVLCVRTLCVMCVVCVRITRIARTLCVRMPRYVRIVRTHTVRTHAYFCVRTMRKVYTRSCVSKWARRYVRTFRHAYVKCASTQYARAYASEHTVLCIRCVCTHTVLLLCIVRKQSAHLRTHCAPVFFFYGIFYIPVTTLEKVIRDTPSIP